MISVRIYAAAELEGRLCIAAGRKFLGAAREDIWMIMGMDMEPE